MIDQCLAHFMREQDGTINRQRQQECLTAAVVLVGLIISQAAPAALPVQGAWRGRWRAIERLALRPLRQGGAGGHRQGGGCGGGRR